MQENTAELCSECTWKGEVYFDSQQPLTEDMDNETHNPEHSLLNTD